MQASCVKEARSLSVECLAENSKEIFVLSRRKSRMMPIDLVMSLATLLEWTGNHVVWADALNGMWLEHRALRRFQEGSGLTFCTLCISYCYLMTLYC